MIFNFGWLGALGLLFIGLKLGGCIAWSWWLVLLPLYGPAAALLGCVLAILLFAVLAAAIAALVGGSRATRRFNYR